MTLAERLRARLEAGGARGTVFLTGDHLDLPSKPDGGERTAAAVLVAVTDRDEPGVILTQRTTTLRRHPGQVAFPGGRIDPEDDGPVAAALREAEEEIGLPRGLPELVGIADRYRTVTWLRRDPGRRGGAARSDAAPA
jgi:8-oxo-dGTP pyrophosphatase MutT (NUDIX family)